MMEPKKVAGIYIKSENNKKYQDRLEKCLSYIRSNNYTEYSKIYHNNKITSFKEYDTSVLDVNNKLFDYIIISTLDILNNKRKMKILRNSIPIKNS